MNFIVYNNTTGIILRVGECHEDILANQAQIGETAIEGVANDETEYISGGIVASRPAITATWDKTAVTANGSDTATLGATLPNPTVVIVSVPDGVISPEPEEVTTGSFTFATPISGEYTVVVTPPAPYLKHTQVITAT